MALTPAFYVLLATLLVVVIFFVLLLQRMEKLARQSEDAAKRQDEAEAALREHVKLSAGSVEQSLARTMEADAQAQATLLGFIRAQQAALEANANATAQLTGAVNDLRAALIESTKL